MLLNAAMKELGLALCFTIVLSLAREKAFATGGNFAIGRKEEKKFAFFRNVNKGRWHILCYKLACSLYIPTSFGWVPFLCRLNNLAECRDKLDAQYLSKIIRNIEILSMLIKICGSILVFVLCSFFIILYIYFFPFISDHLYQLCVLVNLQHSSNRSQTSSDTYIL